jgi:hypothetical protein
MDIVSESTRTGNALFALTSAAALIALGWLLWSLPGWLEGWRLNRTTGAIVLVGLGALALFAMTVAAAVTYGVLGVALEALGLKLKHPAELSKDERANASATPVHAVWYSYQEEDEWEHDITWGVLLSLHRNAQSAQDDCAARVGPPSPEIKADGRYSVEDPVNLLALHDSRFASTAEARSLLAGRSTNVPPKVRYSPVYYRQMLRAVPLSDEECRRALEVQVWTIYYEDRYHIGANRETWPVAVCLTQGEADAEVERRGPVQHRADGYLASGPHPLVIEQARSSPAVGADTVREVLRRVECGESGPVALR